VAGARRIVIQYAPRKQFMPLHQRQTRWAVMVAHRRAGKTVACINDLIRRAALCPYEHGRYAYVAPFLSQAKEVAWEYLKRYALPLTADKNESELWVELITGARIRIHGADNPDRLRGAYLDGVVLDEYADMRPSVWGEVIRPMLTDRQGWSTFIGTPKGRNAFHKVWEGAQGSPEWMPLMLRASETGILPAGELEAAAKDMTPEQYAQEFECSFDAAILGAYFGKEIAEAERAGRIRDVPYDPHVPVYSVWDLGKGVNMAVWLFQIVGPEIHVIDFHEGAHSDGIPQVVRELNDRPYPIKTDWVPHDARATEIGTGRTRIETMVALRRNPELVPDLGVEDGINAARLTMARCYFDRNKCAAGLEALRQYRAEFDEKTAAFKDHPRKDWTNHAADAFRYLCTAWREIAQPVVKRIEPMRGIENITGAELMKLSLKPKGSRY